MRTVTCILTFSDGKTLTGKAAAKSRDETVPYQFSGLLSRILALPEKGTVDFLECYLKGWATNLGGDLPKGNTLRRSP